jgi:hypothetical protein
MGVSGQLRSDSWDFCLENTKLINQKDDMQIEAELNLQAMVSTQKLLIFDKAEKLVTFPTAGQNFTNACQRSGGIIRIVKNEIWRGGLSSTIHSSGVHNMSVATFRSEYRYRHSSCPCAANRGQAEEGHTVKCEDFWNLCFLKCLRLSELERHNHSCRYVCVRVM